MGTVFKVIDEATAVVPTVKILLEWVDDEKTGVVLRILLGGVCKNTIITFFY